MSVYISLNQNTEVQKNAKLKPSLKSYSSFDNAIRNDSKLGHTRSLSNISTISSLSTASSLKNVRFATNLTTVKSFDSNSEPISISHENSPTLKPLRESESSNVSSTSLNNVLYLSDYDDFTKHQDLNFLGIKSKSTISFFLDDEEDDEEDDGIHDDDLKNFFGKIFPAAYNVNTSNKNLGPPDCSNTNQQRAGLLDSNNSSTCKIIPKFSTNVCQTDNSAGHYFNDLNGSTNNQAQTSRRTSITHVADDNLQNCELASEVNWLLTFVDVNPGQHSFENSDGNIKLVSLAQDSTIDDKIVGKILVKNLNYEKFIEVKYTFNNWNDIHYITAYFTKSISAEIDEFEFKINLSSLKYILQFKRILQFKSNDTYLNMELCCRYDVNGETYYDNNNYRNYNCVLKASKEHTIANDVIVTAEEQEKKELARKESPKKISQNKKSSSPSRNNYSKNFLKSRRRVISRKFSENTDYYNTSPLKHLYHSDPTSYIKPKRLNEVLYDSTSTIPTDLNQRIGINATCQSLHEPLTERERFISEFDFANLNDSMDTLTTVNLMNHSIANIELNSEPVEPIVPSITNKIEENISNNPILQEVTDPITESFNEPITIEPVRSNENEVSDDKQSVVTDTTIDIEALKLSGESPISFRTVDSPIEYYDCYSTSNNSVETITKPTPASPSGLTAKDLRSIDAPKSFQDSISTSYNIPMENSEPEDDLSDRTTTIESTEDPVFNTKWDNIVVDTELEDTGNQILLPEVANSSQEAKDTETSRKSDTDQAPHSPDTDYQKFLNSNYFCRPSSSSSSVSTTDSSSSSSTSILTDNASSLVSVPSSITTSDSELSSFIFNKATINAKVQGKLAGSTQLYSNLIFPLSDSHEARPINRIRTGRYSLEENKILSQFANERPANHDTDVMNTTLVNSGN